MDVIGKASAVIGWAWEWCKWAWAKVADLGNQVIDPPPHRIKYYVVVVLAIGQGLIKGIPPCSISRPIC